MITDNKEIKPNQYTVSQCTVSSASRYTIGSDPYKRLNWLQSLLQKTGLFYKNRPVNVNGVFRWKEDGSVEFVEYRKQ